MTRDRLLEANTTARDRLPEANTMGRDRLPEANTMVLLLASGSGTAEADIYTRKMDSQNPESPFISRPEMGRMDKVTAAIVTAAGDIIPNIM